MHSVAFSLLLLAPPPKGDSAWLTDFPAAQAAARKDGKPILAVLY